VPTLRRRTESIHGVKSHRNMISHTVLCAYEPHVVRVRDAV
jgi:hypothetical protein